MCTGIVNFVAGICGAIDNDWGGRSAGATLDGRCLGATLGANLIMLLWSRSVVAQLARREKRSTMM